jgi:aspartyl-tRNA(Asn)/glutamyl-tRNA(Gln) amidotransferase subunit A
LTLHEAAAKLQAREISATEMTRACLARIEATEPDIHACISVLGDSAPSAAKTLDEKGPDPQKSLWGVPIALKDLFCLKGTKTTAASKMLENFVPSYDAQVVTKLHQAGAIIVAKSNLDEFAMGTSTATSLFGPSRNPGNTAKVPGGSSGGAAASMAAYQTPGGFATDTGGSIRQPASFCGCVALKPTYGRVSRYGVIGLASSFDQVGPIARRVIDCAHLLQAVAGPDERDSTAAVRPVDEYTAARPLPLKGLRLGLPKELWSIALDLEIDGPIKAAVASLEEAGAELRPVSMPSLKYAVAAYHVLSCAEGSTNMARYDGVRFGYRAKKNSDLNELYTASRSESLGPEVMRRVVLGTFALSAEAYEAYYKQAARVRRLIRDEYCKALDECDVLMSPVTAIPAWDAGFQHDLKTRYELDQMTLPVNLAGLPALTLPIGRGAAEGLPVGIHLVGRAFGESALFSAGLSFEELFPPLL